MATIITCDKCGKVCQAEYMDGTADIGDGTSHNFGDTFGSNCCDSTMSNEWGGEYTVDDYFEENE